MRTIEISAATWKRLLDFRQGTIDMVPLSDPAFAIYAPIAGARTSFVLAQVGQSLDGRVATPSGDARDVSGPDGLAHLHRCRALVDAVIVGATTVKTDDPRLSVRLMPGTDPVRVVIDCHGALSGDEGLFHDHGAPVIVIRSSEIDGKALPNAEVVALRPQPSGLDPGDILRVLSHMGLHRILVEGGARTIARFIEAQLVDHLHVTVSPILIGSGPSGIRLPPIDRLASARRPTTEVYSLGSDILFDCRFKAEHKSWRQGKKIEMADLA